MAEKTKIEIPEDIINEVRAMSNQLKDMRREALWICEKAKLQNAKMWDLIGDKLKETRGVPCSLDLDEGVVVLNSGSEVDDLLRRLLGGME